MQSGCRGFLCAFHTLEASRPERVRLTPANRREVGAVALLMTKVKKWRRAPRLPLIQRGGATSCFIRPRNETVGGPRCRPGVYGAMCGAAVVSTDGEPVKGNKYRRGQKIKERCNDAQAFTIPTISRWRCSWVWSRK